MVPTTTLETDITVAIAPGDSLVRCQGVPCPVVTAAKKGGKK
jgi:hypothetical protein